MVHSLGRKNIIEFLVERKFPPLVLANVPAKPPPKGTTTLDRILRHQEMERYRGELQALSDEQLQARHHSEQAKLLDEIQREEESRFFNQPHAAADFDHWSKAEHWSLEEAVALAMGKAPELVSWVKIQSYGQISPFVQKYGRLRDLAQRAVPWKKLYDPVLPTIFLKWAKDNEISVPAELSEKVFKLKGGAADWKKNYDELHAMYDQHVADWKGVAEKQSELIESKQKRIAELESELAATTGAPPVPEPAKTQSLIERQNMLKTIFGMAVRGYSYNPADKRSKTVSEIVSDLELEGIPLSDDTIRRYLKEARDLLSEWQQQAG
ncbi:hypothetical protein [Bradyrhizobium liaoningense]|uniref:hypothetical protein n=1 Tax=Bradyrhizobium liaoningense TaxID=43992 RepID=UPI001BA784D9|nr:hypothetical protein [Bradyrhizobium liaoningense]MBR0940207.1 hypothetical protein [Bradyrhizobium liaoningense]